MKSILSFFLLLVFGTVSAAAHTTTDRATHLTAAYGSESAQVMLTIGNGGAGPTCVLQALSEDFIRLNNLNIRIGWIQTITRLTLENLKEKIIDVSLTYEEEPELLAIKEGWASNRTLIFNDHFILVGPKNNPAGVLPTDSVQIAFAKIAKKGAFFSRNDFSGSNERERSVWKELKIAPWEKSSSWYVTQSLFPADALKRADKENLYTLSDRGTLLAISDDLSNTAVYIQNGEVLMNRCHALLQSQPSDLALKFLNYLKSSRAQTLIEKYCGKNKQNCIECCPLFTSAQNDAFLFADCLEKMGFEPSI